MSATRSGPITPPKLAAPGYPWTVSPRAFLAPILLALLARPAQAAPAMTMTLPVGTALGAWAEAAALGGFRLGADAAGPHVAITADAAGWHLHAVDAAGVTRDAVVAAPGSSQDREDLVWLARSLLTPVGQGGWGAVSAPADPVATATPLPPVPSAPGARVAVARAPSVSAPSESTPVAALVPAPPRSIAVATTPAPVAGSVSATAAAAAVIPAWPADSPGATAAPVALAAPSGPANSPPVASVSSPPPVASVSLAGLETRSPATAVTDTASPAVLTTIATPSPPRDVRDAGSSPAVTAPSSPAASAIVSSTDPGPNATDAFATAPSLGQMSPAAPPLATSTRPIRPTTARSRPPAAAAAAPLLKAQPAAAPVASVTTIAPPVASVTTAASPPVSVAAVPASAVHRGEKGTLALGVAGVADYRSDVQVVGAARVDVVGTPGIAAVPWLRVGGAATWQPTAPLTGLGDDRAVSEFAFSAEAGWTGQGHLRPVCLAVGGAAVRSFTQGNVMVKRVATPYVGARVALAWLPGSAVELEPWVAATVDLGEVAMQTEAGMSYVGRETLSAGLSLRARLGG